MEEGKKARSVGLLARLLARLTVDEAHQGVVAASACDTEVQIPD